MPRAGDAFLTGALPQSHDPLSRIDFQGIAKEFDLTALFTQVTSLFTDYLIPIIEDITGLDLSSPEAFILSLVTLILNGGTAVAALIQAIVQPIVDFIINGLTGGSGNGNPLSLLQPLFAAMSGVLSTAINSANQATDIARQMMALVMQIVQGLDDLPVIGDFFDAIQGFAFWVLGWFGITQQSVTGSNPAVAALQGQVAALQSINTVGLEGFSDHFDRAAIGTDWTTITPFPALNIQGSQYIKASYRNAGRYTANTLLTDNVHAQVTLQQLENGISDLYICCPTATTDAGFTSGAFLAVEQQFFPFNQGGRTYVHIGYLTGGMTPGTVVATATFDYGNVKDGDVLAIEYYSASNTFFVFLNSNEITSLRWTDTSNHVTHGSGHREVALMQCALDNASFPGPGLDDLSAYDIKVT